MKTVFKIIFSIVTVLYPVLVFVLLVVYRFPVRIISLCVIALGLVFFVAATGNSSRGEGNRLRLNPKNLASSLLFFAVGLVCFLTNSPLFLKLYPVAVCATFLFVFGMSVFSPPCIVFRFAVLQDKSILQSPQKKRIENYCFKVTCVWCVFFVLNIAAALYTAFFASERVWSLYNGGISYAIMGLIFFVEYIVRRVFMSKMGNYYPISKFRADSRADSHIVCFDGIWSQKNYKTWKDFLVDTARLRKFILSKGARAWILHCDDSWHFLTALVALLQCKKQVMLTANITPLFLGEMRQADWEFLSDVKDAPAATFIPDVLDDVQASEEEIRSAPEFNSDETEIHLFTSGSTGHPKDVLQRMTEFEEDNAFVFSKWGGEFLKRKLLATVSHHHIYGFLFSICLPFAAGVPFRRKRIEFPSEFEKFDDESYMIIAVPAFLKRTNEIEKSLPLKEPFIFTSGGVLLPQVAKSTDEVFGFWPVEVYGSTETSGIAYRQSKNGLEWTPFDNAKIWKNDDGCLVIKSSYIKDPAGFETSDLVEILPDGRFLLNGRADSIVKIEEKRVSLTEVENRILQSGFVKDVCVVPMSDKRQYLAAAVVFNEQGKARFGGAEKFDINKAMRDYLTQFFEGVVIPRKWRYLDALPTDLQGKHKREEILSLFTKER